jgi:hypothetical protein
MMNDQDITINLFDGTINHLFYFTVWSEKMPIPYKKCQGIFNYNG